MKVVNRAAALFFGLILLANVISAQQVTDVTQLVRTAKQSVVFINLDDDVNDGKGVIGSGFFVAPNRVVTNYHVIDGMHVGEVKLASGQTFQIQGVVAYDVDADLAMLQVKVPSGVTIPLLKVTGKLPEQGERVIAIGNPKGLDWTISDGLISAFRDSDRGDSRIQMTVPISGGSSGGPVLNLRGEVIGVAVSGRTDAQNINFAVPGERVLALQPHAPISLSKLATDEAAQRLATAEKLYKQAWSLADGGNCKEAVPQLDRAVQVKPDYVAAWVELGYCYNQLGNYKDALSVATYATKLNPRHTLAFYYAAQALRGLERLPEAIQTYKDTLTLDPTFDRAYSELASTYNQSKRYDEAVEAYRQAARLKPSNAAYYNGMGASYLNAGNYKAAVEMLEQTLRLDPGFAIAHYNLGVAYDNQNKTKNAITAYKQCLRYDPKDAYAHYRLALAYLKNGDKADATAEYNVLRTLDAALADKLLAVMYK